MRAYFIVVLSVTLVSHVLAQGPGGVDQRRQRSPTDVRRRQPGGLAVATLEPKASTGLIPLAEVTPSQVQVMWMLHAIAGPSVHGEFPAHARKLKEFTAAAVRKAAARYPNLKLIYLSSRTYAGYAIGGLNPEPYAYQSAYAMRWLIQEQMAGRPELNADPSRGAVRIPVLTSGNARGASAEAGQV